MVQVQYRTRFEVTTRAGLISNTGLREITRYLRIQELPDLPADWRWEWLVMKGSGYRGKFAKRVGQFYRTEHGIEVNDGVLQTVGNLARMHMELGSSYCFEFRETVDWQDGEFSDDGSCFWGSYTGARLMVDANGFAVCFFNDGKGLGRAWLAPLNNDCYIVFNGYGFAGDSTLTIARVLAIHFGGSYKELALRDEADAMYINGDRGFMIGAAQAVDSVEKYVLNWPGIDANTCEKCRSIIREKDVTYGAEGDAVCPTCFEKYYLRCERCHRARRRKNIKKIGGRLVCNWCLNEALNPLPVRGKYTKKTASSTKTYAKQQTEGAKPIV